MAIHHVAGPWLLAGLGAMLLLAGAEDARHRTIGNGKNAAIALAAPLWWWAAGLSPWPDMAVQAAVALAVLAAFAAAFHFGAMGGGDVKMIAALALWFPWPVLARFLLTMSLIGGAVTALMLVGRRRGAGAAVEVPYGVAVAAAGLLALGEPLLNPGR